MGGTGKAIEVAKTVLEVADVAWKAVEISHHHHPQHTDETHDGPPPVDQVKKTDEELEALRLENKRLRDLLEQNLKLLQNLSESPFLLEDCPPDLHAHLLATVDSESFLTRLKSLQQATVDETSIHFPFKEATGDDIQSAEVLINVDHDEPSWWVWVSEDMFPSIVEERSGIDFENYLVITEEHVVDGVANFMARCIISNPKAHKLTPEQLQKTLAKALGGVSKLEKMMDIWHAGKLFYALSTWGLAMAGLYRTRAVVKLAAMGVHTTSKMVLRAL